ncbi:MAG: ACP S-malonyltransferase [Chloroflexia bacterium]|nr:ACP S-malonyltransferase [Chloroflexia bacterium]
MAVNVDGETPVTMAMVFPGQGSQFAGMGREIMAASGAARAIFAEADDILGIALTRLCHDGPAKELEDTYNAQPAILTVGVATLAAIRERAAEAGRTIEPAVVAGHSLGEFTALVASDAFDFADALRLVRERGRLMREAGELSPGGMAAVIGLDDEALAAVCAGAASEGLVAIANANCPGQTVISGEVPALLRAMDLAKAAGAKRVARLAVSIASHSPLMAEASAALGEAVAATPMRPPRVPVIANVTARPMTTPEEIRAELRQQMERPVQWTDSVRTMAGMGMTTVIELGPGQVLSGLIKRIDRTLVTLGPADLDLGLPTERPTAG